MATTNDLPLPTVGAIVRTLSAWGVVRAIIADAAERGGWLAVVKTWDDAGQRPRHQLVDGVLFTAGCSIVEHDELRVVWDPVDEMFRVGGEQLHEEHLPAAGKPLRLVLVVPAEAQRAEVFGWSVHEIKRTMQSIAPFVDVQIERPRVSSNDDSFIQRRAAVATLLVMIGYAKDYADLAAHDLAGDWLNGEERPTWRTPGYMVPEREGSS
jgi:hypothetical protein